MKDILEVKNLSKKYPDFMLRNININLPYGKIMGIVGENGAGKTTIVKLLLNGLKREQGVINFLVKIMYSLKQRLKNR